MKKLRLDDLKHFPAIVAAPSLALGIYLNDLHPLPLWFLIPAFAGSLIWLITLAVNELFKVAAPLAAATAFFLGGALIVFSNSGFNADPLGKIRQSDVNVTTEIDEIRELNSDRISFTGYVAGISYDTTFRVRKGAIKEKHVKTVNVKFDSPVKLIFELREPSPTLFNALSTKLAPGRHIALSGSFFKPLDRRNPGGFDHAAYLKRQKISASVFVYADSSIAVAGDPDPVHGTIFAIRQSIARKIDELHDPQTAAIMKGLVIADRAAIDQETLNNYIDTGIAHILAVSGFNVGIIYLLSLLLFQKLKPVSRNGELVARLIILFLFLIITQFQITVVRAVVMFAVHSILKYSGRESNSWNTLSLTAIITLIYDPQDLFSTSFQLSVAAVSGLFIAERMKTEFLRAIYRGIAEVKGKSQPALEKMTRSAIFRNGFELVTVTILVQLFMLPFLIGYFGKVTLLSIPANIVGVPLSSFMLINGILTLFFSIFSTGLASTIAVASTAVNQIINIVTSSLRSTGWGSIEITGGTATEAVLFYTLILVAAVLIAVVPSFKRRIVIILACSFAIITSHFVLREPLLRDGRAYLIAVDIGQGDSFLLRNSTGETWLIDAGPVSKRFDSGENIIKPLLKQLGIDSISLALISHYDNDHSGGILSLYKSGIIKKLAVPPPDTLAENDIAFLNIFSRTKKPIILKDGVVFSAGDMKLTVRLNDLTPGMESNTRSAVMMVELKGKKILFTGDLDKKGENSLMRKMINLECDLLKVSHHGSITGTSQAFLEQTNPEIALISAGAGNRFRHPHPEVIDRLDDAGIRVLRTDLEGCFVIQIDSNKISQIDWR